MYYDDYEESYYDYDYDEANEEALDMALDMSDRYGVSVSDAYQFASDALEGSLKDPRKRELREDGRYNAALQSRLDFHNENLSRRSRPSQQHNRMLHAAYNKSEDEFNAKLDNIRAKARKRPITYGLFNQGRDMDKANAECNRRNRAECERIGKVIKSHENKFDQKRARVMQAEDDAYNRLTRYRASRNADKYSK